MHHLDGNIRALERRLDCPLLGVVPFRQNQSAEDASRLLSLELLSEATA
jgi:cobyric acid synthase